MLLFVFLFVFFNLLQTPKKINTLVMMNTFLNLPGVVLVVPALGKFQDSRIPLKDVCYSQTC